ncbi:MAG: hypothetical protein AAB619_04120 [Patescibacteria group bacterium]
MVRRTSLTITKTHLDASEQRIRSSITDLARHFTGSLGKEREHTDRRFDEVNSNFDEVNAKLDAITEMLAMRQEMQNLIRELKAKGIILDESKIFVS